MEGLWNVQGTRIMPISPVRWLEKEKKKDKILWLQKALTQKVNILDLKQ